MFYSWTIKTFKSLPSMADGQKQKVYMLWVMMMTLIPSRRCNVVLHFGHVRNQNQHAQRKVQTTNVIQPSNFSWYMWKER